MAYNSKLARRPEPVPGLRPTEPTLASLETRIRILERHVETLEHAVKVTRLEASIQLREQTRAPAIWEGHVKAADRYQRDKPG
jgi:hypothetical protein